MIENIAKHYLYRHIRLDKNEPFYIGIGTKTKYNSSNTVNEYGRAYTKDRNNTFWKRIVAKADYEVEILLESDDYEFIKQKEIEFIALYGRKNNNTGILVNLTDGGEGTKGLVVSEETKKLQILNNLFRLNQIEEYNRKRVGEQHRNKQGYIATIIEYFGSKNCTIQFNDEQGTILSNIAYVYIKKGNIQNPHHRSVCGVGYFGIGKYKNSSLKAYNSWNCMINKVYSDKYSTYKDVVVCEEWHNFQIFAEWFENNYEIYMDSSWHLDKDILVRGNKIYSPDTCCFVPNELMNIFMIPKKGVKDLPTGVVKQRSNKYTTLTRISGKTTRFKDYNTPEEAYKKYIEIKEQDFKDKANKWKELIEEKTYNALINYKILD